MKLIIKSLFIDVALVAGLACIARGGSYLHPAAPWLVIGIALTVAGVLGMKALAIEKRKAPAQ